LRILASGGDPYLHGPARDYPENRPLVGRIRLRCAEGGGCQIFYFREGASEEKSVHFDVPAGKWVERDFDLPPLGSQWRLRFDPPPNSTETVLAWMRFEPRMVYAAPSWPKPSAPAFDDATLRMQAGELELIHARDQLGGFILKVEKKPFAIGQNRPLVGYVLNEQVHWLDLTAAAGRKLSVRKQRNGIRADLSCRDAQGARWEITQSFARGPIPDSISVVSEMKVDQDRAVLFAPMFALFPGAQSFGQSKGQAVFAGLEYLDNEPSSSEADVIGPGSHRQVPDDLKITFPLMAIQHGGSYVAVSWHEDARFSAVFDSPDRLFDSGGHVMGLIFPGSDGKNREEGKLLPRKPEILKANRSLTLRATILGGKGESIVPAVRQFVTLRGLPPLPDAKMDLQGYAAFAAHGWLDSKIREGTRFRHAVGANFGAGAAADAAVYMDWSAAQVSDSDLSNRLRETAKAALGEVPPNQWNFASVGHVRYPVAALLYGKVLENSRQAGQHARNLAKQFDADGAIRYRASANGPDFAKTHFTNEASGLTAQHVNEFLRAAAFAGDKALISEALNRLRALDRFRNGVPRGAQTWEVPLHTPDILGSANLVHAYVLGYELTSEQEFLEQARYWAWTGVPFVYLRNPAGQAIGPYSTIAVFGATHWKAPVWMGLPVQWCGLVYADALYQLARHDTKGPWKKLADGITISGIQQSYPLDKRDVQGLLPDSFVLRSQRRNPADINPGTLQACAAHLFGKPIYDFHVFRESGLQVHAPGRILAVQNQRDRATFEIESWRPEPYFVLLNGIPEKASVRVNGREAKTTPGAAASSAVLELRGKARVEVLAK
jgi:hypothetical protein